MSATMRDIATRAGVSRSTVSFVLNNKHAEMGVNEETQRRVRRVAEEMGYRRNELARAVVTGKIPMVGFLVPASMLESEVTARVLNGILDAAESLNHMVQVIRLSANDNRRTSEDEATIRRCLELRPAAVMGMYIIPEVLNHLHQEMSRFDIPIAVIDSGRPVADSWRVRSDDIEGGRQVVQHLASLGHRRIAFIGGGDYSVVNQLRRRGYQEEMQNQGLPVLPGYLEVGDWVKERIEQATLRLFRDLPQPPTAIFCADDKTAMVCCRTLHAMGLQVPTEVSLVGYADLVMASYNDPPLTTIAQPFKEMGKSAVHRLLQRSAEDATQNMVYMEEGENQNIFYEELLPTQLIVRQSTAPAKQ